VLSQLNDLPLRNAPNLIQMQTAPALHILGLFRGPKESVRDHGDRYNGSSRHRQYKFPVCKQRFQRAFSNDAADDAKNLWSCRCVRSGTHTPA
jgi:hypothetical protein